MGILDRLSPSAQFIEVIEWLDDSGDTMMYRFPVRDQEIKNGAQLIVRESQAAVFVHEGQIADVFGPGRFAVEGGNTPILSKLGDEFKSLGLELTKFVVENISLLEHVEAAMGKRTSVGVLGDRGNYPQ